MSNFKVGDIVKYQGKYVNTVLKNFAQSNFKILKLREDKNRVQCQPLEHEKGYFWFEINEIYVAPNEELK